MIRHCDGSDNTVGLWVGRNHSYCGQTFDDVDHLVICPHRKLGPKLNEEELHELLDAVTDDRPLDPSVFRPEVLETFDLQGFDRLRGKKENQ